MTLVSLFGICSIVWIAIFVYVLSIDRRSRRMERELEELRKRR
jgi:CcmD family protein